MNEDLVFYGFRDFDSTKKVDDNGNPMHYYVLEFITRPIITKDNSRAYHREITVFTTRDKYYEFIENNALEDVVSVAFELNGDRVRYYI